MLPVWLLDLFRGTLTFLFKVAEDCQKGVTVFFLTFGPTSATAEEALTSKAFSSTQLWLQFSFNYY